MPLLVHIAPEPLAKRIRRCGIAPRRLNAPYEGYDRLLWAFPVVESFTLTHQWARELKRTGARTLVAVTFRIPDDEPVLVHRYHEAPTVTTAAAAVAAVCAMLDPRGGEVVIPRRIHAAEIVRVKPIPRAFGWRYFPDAKSADRRPCDCPMCTPRGEIKAKRYRDRIPSLTRRWDERHGKP